MLVQCKGCGTTYRISDTKIPPGGVKVRCPKCRVVFLVSSEVERKPETLGEKLFGKDVVRRPFIEEKVGREEVDAGLGPARTEITEAPRVETPLSAGTETGEERAGTGQTEAGNVEEPGPAGDAAAEGTREKTAEPGPQENESGARVTGEPLTPRHDAAEGMKPDVTKEEDPRNLARALVSDVLFYNREKRDRGLAEGRVLAYLGKEITRSWELYKDRVGIEKAIGMDHFREAVNEILGGDKEII